MSKKILSLIIAAVLIFSSTPQAVFAADAASTGDFSYIYNDEGLTAVVSGFSGEDKENVVIPETVAKDGKKYKVTGIGRSAFAGKSAVKTLFIPKTVTSIESRAFFGARNLKTVTGGSSVTRIGSFAFSGTTSLTDFDSKNEFSKVTEIEASAFAGSAVTKVVSSEWIKSIGASAYQGSGITEVRTNGRLLAIGANAFAGCEDLKMIWIYKHTAAETYVKNSANELPYSYVNEIGFTVKYDANGGGPKDTGGTQNVGYKSKTAAKDVFYYNGDTQQEIASWNTKADGTGTKVELLGDVSTLTSVNGATVTLYAQYPSGQLYTIEYILDGGVNSPNNPTYYYFGSGRIKLEPATREGYTFEGWYTDADYKYPISEIKTGVKNNNGKYTLRAKWSVGVSKYKVYFNGNGNTNKSATMAYKVYKVGESNKLPENKFKRTGYKFVGWNVRRNGTGKSYKDGAKVKNLTKADGGNVTLYAQWKKK